MRYHITILCTLAILAACNPHNKAKDKATEPPADTITSFPQPVVPVALTDPDAQVEYIALNYWNKVDFADTNYVHHPEIIEQAWANHIGLLGMVSPKVADKAIGKLFAQAGKEKKCYLYMAGLAERYLYEPNSPLRNEELYISVLDALLSGSVLDDVEKQRPAMQREQAQRNRRGTRATDFTYTLASGRTGTLHGLKAPYTVLFFNNPECHSCEETIKELEHAPVLNRLLDSGKAKLLSVYPDGILEEWQRHIDDYPKKWINGYDKPQDILKGGLYDLRAMPTLYLLDKDKTVLLKDASAMEIEEYLKRCI